MSEDDGVGVVVVVVLSYNRREDLLLALKSIYASDYRYISVVVVDNNSSDGSADAVARSYPDTALIRSPENLGVSRGRNLGWRYANEHFKFDYVIFIDDDSEVARDYFTQIVGAYRKHPEVGLVAAKSYVATDSNVLCSVGLSINLYTGLVHDIGAGRRDKGQYNRPAYRDACPGFAFSVRRALFDQLGGFDEHYSPYGWEDADFCLRAKSVGYKVYYAPDANVIHKGTRIGRGPNPVYERSKMKHYCYFLGQHTNFLQKCTCAVCVPLEGLYVIAKMISNGHSRIVFSQLRGFFEGLQKSG